MNRVARSVIVFGGLGLFTSVAVAWASAATVDLWSDIWIQRHGISDDQYPCWGLVIIEKPTATYVYRTAISRPHTTGVGWDKKHHPPTWSQARKPPSTQALDTYVGYVEDGRGWPLICLTSSIDATLVNPGPGWTYRATSWGIRLPSTQGPDRMPRSLPLRPLWAGLLLDTAFYGTMIWFLVRGPFRVRRWYWERQGRCGRCGYPAGSSAQCSECGEPLHPVRSIGVA